MSSTLIDNDNPLVVIQTITYNQEAYIRDALEGIVSQQTKFRFVAIVHDDASTDSTAEIIREYATKYPDIIKPILETENQYSKHDGSLGRIIRKATDDTGAKYVAMCEGDDYWTDPLKLQKQVDFLESNPDYSMCFGNAMEHWENGQQIDKPFSEIKDKDYSGLEMLEKWIVPTASVLYRNEVAKIPTHVKLRDSGKLLAGDIAIFLACAKCGKVRGFSDFFSVYRRLDSGVVRSVMDKQPYRFMIHEIALGNAYKGEIRNHLKQNVANRVVTSLKKFKDGGKLDLKYVWRGFRFAPLETIRQLIRYM